MDDFLIIGGGIAGVSAGARLAEFGRVTLLEAETALAYHASGRSAALYVHEHGPHATVALARASKDDFLSAEGWLSPRGVMFIAGAGEEETLARNIADYRLTPISVDEARQKVPVLDPARVVAAGWDEEAWDIDTDRMIQSYARAVRANGQIVTGAKVEKIRRTAQGWQVEAGGATHEARVLVNAAGAWADAVARMAGLAPIGLVPKRRSIARVAAPEGFDPSPWPMTFGAGESWYMKPDAGALLISPADAEPTTPHDAWADDMVLAEGIARWEDRVTTPVTRMIANWAGLRTFAPDGNVVLGPAPQDDAFVWCAGQGGFGFLTAPGASRLVADRVTGRQSALDARTLSETDPARFA
ncbi:MAG: FAD-binding oxidoreductase [Alphaproteobacteria bacterium]|nr:MAG: FAD-binding oxidoreductase [Alphaproteobacteria bacterium]